MRCAQALVARPRSAGCGLAARARACGAQPRRCRSWNAKACSRSRRSARHALEMAAARALRKTRGKRISCALRRCTLYAAFAARDQCRSAATRANAERAADGADTRHARETRLAPAQPTRLTRPTSGARAAARAARAVRAAARATCTSATLEPHALYPLRNASTTQSWVVGRELTFASESVTLLRSVPLIAAARAGLLGLFDGDARARSSARACFWSRQGVLQDEHLNREASALAPKISQRAAPRAGPSLGGRRLARRCAVALEPRLRVARSARRADRRGRSGAGAERAWAQRRRSARARDSRQPSRAARIELLRFWLSNDCADLLRDQRGAA